MSLESAIADYRAATRLLRLQGVAQHYEWGGYDFIPNLLRQPNPDRRPFAELWMGAHASAPSLTYLDGNWVGLDQLLAAAADAILGPDENRFGGRLPYLLKILDARQMLSIQAHPTREQAQAGFARENAAGIPLKAPERNYKDENHKPEVHVSLGGFWMLHGFRPLEEIAATLHTVPELALVMPTFTSRLSAAGNDDAPRKALLRDLYGRVMTMPQEEVDALLDPILRRLEAAETPPKDTPEYWVRRAERDFPLPGGHRDRGIFSIYLLNLVNLSAGQATYQPAGMLHAYLEGANVELMANSDNVLRGGLTPKHVDVAELMKILTFESGKPEVITGGPGAAAETVFPTPADEFELSRIEVTPGQSYHSLPAHGPDVLIVMEGDAGVAAGVDRLDLRRGEIVLAPYNLPYTIRTEAAKAMLFKASVPGNMPQS